MSRHFTIERFLFLKIIEDAGADNNDDDDVRREQTGTDSDVGSVDLADVGDDTQDSSENNQGEETETQQQNSNDGQEQQMSETNKEVAQDMEVNFCSLLKVSITFDIISFLNLSLYT